MKRKMDTSEVLAETTSNLTGFYPGRMCGGVEDDLIIAGNSLLRVRVSRHVNWDPKPSYELHPMSYQAKVVSNYPRRRLGRTSPEVPTRAQFLERLAHLGDFSLVAAEPSGRLAFENHHSIGVLHEVRGGSSSLRVYQRERSDDLEATLTNGLPRLVEYFNILDPSREIEKQTVEAIAQEARELATIVPILVR